MPFKPGNTYGQGRQKSEATLRTQKMRDELTEYVEKNLRPILEAKGDLAKGVHVIIARQWESKKVGIGKKAHWEKHRTGPFHVIEDEAEIKQLLLEAQPGEGSGDTFYKIVTQKPDNQAGNYLLDQAMGKAKETIETDTPAIAPTQIFIQLNKIYGKPELQSGNGHAGNGRASDH